MKKTICYKWFKTLDEAVNYSTKFTPYQFIEVTKHDN